MTTSVVIDKGGLCQGTDAVVHENAPTLIGQVFSHAQDRSHADPRCKQKRMLRRLHKREMIPWQTDLHKLNHRQALVHPARATARIGVQQCANHVAMRIPRIVAERRLALIPWHRSGIAAEQRARPAAVIELIRQTPDQSGTQRQQVEMDPAPFRYPRWVAVKVDRVARIGVQIELGRGVFMRHSSLEDFDVRHAILRRRLMEGGPGDARSTFLRVLTQGVRRQRTCTDWRALRFWRWRYID